MKDIKVASSSSELDRVLNDFKVTNVFCFMFTSLKQHEPYLADLANYLKSPNDGTQVPTSEIQNYSQQSIKHWLNSDTSQRMRSCAMLFLELAEANKDEVKAKFIIASTEDESNPGASLYLYENGTLVEKKFQLPPKPSSPSTDRKAHNSVTLKLQPLSCDPGETVKHRVESRKVNGVIWIQLDRVDKNEFFTISALYPNTQYQFRYTVCVHGVNVTSALIESKTLPTSPPGQPLIDQLEPSSISISWDKPTAIGEQVKIQSYTEQYRDEGEEATDDNTATWAEKSTQDEACQCTITGVKPNTRYRIRVSSNCGEVGTSAPSDEVTILTPIKRDARVLAKRLIEQSSLLKNRDPSIYKLPTMKVPITKVEDTVCEKFIFGNTEEKHLSKVLVIFGVKESKTMTVINSMINYILRVEWEDNYRFKLVTKQMARSQNINETVNVYEIIYQAGFRILHNLTIICFPEIDLNGNDEDEDEEDEDEEDEDEEDKDNDEENEDEEDKDKEDTDDDKEDEDDDKEGEDKEGEDKEDEDTETELDSDCEDFKYALEVLCSELNLERIDAVCFVVSASQKHFTSTMKILSQKALNTIGKHYAENTVVLITSSDGKTPFILGKISHDKLPNLKFHCKDFFFCINNSALFVSNSAKKNQ
nr:PREDICTED: uncharacterized protein LOC106706295 [Latimeria chalumnae]|eukprot:XP_014352502.1 PREDICTED: uncharacterized protein LOC106706295 [Latimeria chalumnae]